MKYADTYTVYLSENYPVELAKLDIGDGFCIYSFDMTGECEWNRVAARELLKKLDDTMDDNGQPKRKSFFEKIRQSFD